MGDIVKEGSSSNNTGSERNVAIDSIRGIMALIIVLFHFELFVPFGDTKIFTTGYLGVEFFFVLSGFLLTKGYDAKLKNNSFSVLRMIKEKFVRLYPPYLISVLMLMFLYSFLWFKGNVYAWISSDISHVKGLLSELFCIQSLGIFGFDYINGPVWYVSALLIASFVILVLIKFLKSYYVKYMAPVISISLYFCLYKLNMYMDPSSYIYGKMPTAIVRALAGMMLGSFVWFIYTKLRDKLHRLSFSYVSILEIVMFGFLLSMLLFRNASKWNYLILIPIVGIIVMMFSNKGIISKLLSTKLFVSLGSLSYSIYLLQSICSNFVLNVFSEASSWKKIAMYLVLNFVAAAFMHYLVENLLCKHILIKHALVIKLFALCVVIFSITVLINYENNQLNFRDGQNGDIITITALDEQNESGEGSEIWIKGVMVDSVWYPAEDLFEKGWIVNEGEIGWKIYDQPEGIQSSITGIIPYGSERKIIFESNRWRGKAKILFMESENNIDCYSNSESDEISFKLSSNLLTSSSVDINDNTTTINVMYIILIILLLAISIRIYYSFKRKTVIKQAKLVDLKNREIWIDVLRIFCMLNIVVLHGTCAGYLTSFTDIRTWYKFLYINCFTACAVPIFFMISGNLSIKQDKDFVGTLIKRLKKILVPLFVWSIIYILLRKWYVGEDINILKQILKIGSEPQYSHLWFIYTLCGIYILSPIISYFYYNMERKMLYYLGIIFGIIPLFLKTFETLTNYRINIDIIYIFFPEVLLFILGKLIVDNSEKILGKWYVWAGVAFAGYGLVVLATYFTTLKLDSPFKGFFSNYGTLPLFIMYVSIYIMFLKLKDMSSKINYKTKKIILMISDACMGIYFIHMLVYTFLEGKGIGKYFELSINSNSLKLGVMTALICFIVSFIIIIMIKRVKLIILTINNKC